MWSFALVEPKSPRMSLTLDAVENNALSPSLRRGAREEDFRDLYILTSHGGRRQPWNTLSTWDALTSSSRSVLR